MAVGKRRAIAEIRRRPRGKTETFRAHNRIRRHAARAGSGRRPRVTETSPCARSENDGTADGTVARRRLLRDSLGLRVAFFNRLEDRSVGAKRTRNTVQNRAGVKIITVTVGAVREFHRTAVRVSASTRDPHRSRRIRLDVSYELADHGNVYSFVDNTDVFRCRPFFPNAIFRQALSATRECGSTCDSARICPLTPVHERIRRMRVITPKTLGRNHSNRKTRQNDYRLLTLVEMFIYFVTLFIYTLVVCPLCWFVRVIDIVPEYGVPDARTNEQIPQRLARDTVVGNVRKNNND